eukprot:gene7773-7839_t
MKRIIGLALIISLSACATMPQLPVFVASRPDATDDERLHAVLVAAGDLDKQYRDGYNTSAKTQDWSQLPIIGLAAGAALLVLLKAKYVGDLIGGLGIGAAAYSSGRDQLTAKDLPRFYLTGHAALACVTDEATLFDGPTAKTRQTDFRREDSKLGDDIAAMRVLVSNDSPSGIDDIAKQNLVAQKALANSALADADTAEAAAATALQAYDNRVGAFRHAIDAIGTAVATKARARPAVDFASLQASFTAQSPKTGAATGLLPPAPPANPATAAAAAQATIILLSAKTHELIDQTAKVKTLARGNDYAASIARAAKCPDLVGTTFQATIAPGISIGGTGGETGTIGAIVRQGPDGPLLALSNMHVLCGYGQGVNQPGPYDGQNAALGTVVDGFADQDGDAAICTIDHRSVDPRIYGLGVAVEAVRDPQNDDLVVMSGRTSGIRYGKVKGPPDVESIRAATWPSARSINVWRIVSEDGSPPAIDGDSGAMWMACDAQGRATSTAVALQIAKADDDGSALASAAPKIFERLGITPAPLEELLAEADAAQAHHDDLAALTALPGAAAPVATTIDAPQNLLRVTARTLMLRPLPSADQPPIGSAPFGTIVRGLGRSGDWMKVDLQGDGAADGYMWAGMLEPVTASPSSPVILKDITALVTPAMAKAFCPDAGSLAINRNLPFVLAGLRAFTLGDRDMVAMALATIRCETAGFLPIDEGVSIYNTSVEPFDKYEPGTSAGAKLGNTAIGDGVRFKGRGFVQLTGRSNYTRIGAQLGADLVNNPAQANDPATAGKILGQFLANNAGPIRSALATNNLKEARKLVNGGSHGLPDFEAAMAQKPILPT